MFSEGLCGVSNEYGSNWSPMASKNVHFCYECTSKLIKLGMQKASTRGTETHLVFFTHASRFDCHNDER